MMHAIANCCPHRLRSSSARKIPTPHSTLLLSLLLVLLLSFLPPSRGMSPKPSSATAKAASQSTGQMPSLSLEQFESDLRDPMAAQRECLREILAKCSGSAAILKECGCITEHTSLEEFAKLVPLTCYDDYEELINEVADGKADPSLLIGDGDPNEELHSFAVTSGTSRGRPKLIPFTKVDLAERLKVYGLLERIVKRDGLVGAYEGKKLSPSHMGKIFTTKSGHKAGGASSLALASEVGRTLAQRTSATPVEIALMSESKHSVVVYAHLLAALVDRQIVTRLSANYARETLELLQVLEQNVDLVLRHLRDGVEETVDGLVDERSLDVLRRILGDKRAAAAEAADVVERECKSGFAGILTRIFPNCGQIIAVTSGTMIPYAEKLRWYAGPGVPILSLLYTSSEGTVGLNTDPLGTKRRGTTCNSQDGVPLYTLYPRVSVLEFLPYPAQEQSEQPQQPLTLDKLKIGKLYEVIVTSRNGMFRYRLGDVVRVADFEHRTPVVEFLHRSSAVLSLSNEFMSERQLMDATTKATHDSGVAVTEYVFDGDRDHFPPRYVMYCELTSDAHDDSNGDEKTDNFKDNLSRLSDSLDAMLATENSYYKLKREHGSLGAPRIVVVQRGTFQHHMNAMIAKGTDPGQFKTPRCVNNSEFRDILQKGGTAEHLPSTS